VLINYLRKGYTMTNDIYTEDLADFGSREREMAAELLAARLPEGFTDEGVKLAFNRNSGYVFLVNSEYQCAMMNGEELQIFHTTPYHSHEGFIGDLLEEYTPADLNSEDADYIREAAKREGVELPEAWAESEEA
jgi:hypothetical protein